MQCCGRMLISLAMVASLSVVGEAGGLDWGYDTVVKPLPRPSWMENIVIIDSYQNWPFTDGEQNALVPWAKKLQDAGFTIMTYGTIEKAENMRKLGIKVVYGMRPPVAEGWKEEAIHSHPEWLQQKEPGVPIDRDSACLLGGYGQWLVRTLAENVTKFHIDAYTFDGWYQYNFCACEACRNDYKKDTGFDAPARKDGSDPNYRRYVVWRDKKLFDLAIQLRKAVKAANPEAVLISWINNDADGAYPSFMPESLDCVFDMVWKEWWNTDDVLSIWLSKRMRGASGDRMVAMQPYLFARAMKDIEAGVYHGSSMPMNEVLYQMHEILAMGEVPIIWNGARTGLTKADWEKVVQDWVDYLPYVHHTKTLKYAACLDSYTSLQMSKADVDLGFHGPLDKIAYPRGGVARALLESHIPFDVISEHNMSLDTLSQYRVVVLPNCYCMSDKVAKVLRDYVAQGGGLVATFETSLYDDMGDKRTDFALADLFGASYVSTQDTSACRVNFAKDRHPITDDAYMRDIMGTGGYNTYWGKFTRVKPADGVACPLVGTDTNNEKDEALKLWTPLVVREHGKGRVAYFPAAIDTAYFDASYPYQRMAIANAVKWTAKDTPDVLVEAPMCVFVGYFRKTDGGANQTIVHLLNTLNTTSSHGSPADKEFGFREETIPISDIKVTFKGSRPRSVKLIPEKTELKAVTVDAGWQVVVPKMGLHSVVVAGY